MHRETQLIGFQMMLKLADVFHGPHRHAGAANCTAADVKRL